MPLSKEETLALSNALVSAVRKHVMFSTNIAKFYNDQDFKDIACYNVAFSDEAKKYRASREKSVTKTIKNHSGVCDEPESNVLWGI